MKPRVVNSISNQPGDHCVDIFARDDGTFGFDEYRRDAEDGRGWFPLNRFGHLAFATEDEALAAAKAHVEWLAPEPAFHLRRATELDREALDALYRECRRAADWLPAVRSQASFAAVSAGEAVFVAVDATGLLGLVSAWEAEPFIHHLYVREESRRTGVAAALLDALVGTLPFPWRLKCVRANTQALDFYLKRGWRQTGEGVGSEGAYFELQLDRPLG